MTSPANALTDVSQHANPKPGTMKALVFRGANDIQLEERSIPKAGPSEAIIKVTLTTICGTDVHIVKREYPVQSGLILGHEAVGTIYKLGAGISRL
jgi:alcohol dehydrogenase